MLFEIETPAVLVDLDIAEANIDRFQAYCRLHDLNCRPHIKTHKLPVLAQRQIAAGAVGITCQKVSEAEAMIADGGIDDVLLTYNVIGAGKLSRLRALAERVTLAVVADNSQVVAGLSEAFAAGGRPLSVLVECDTGAHRCGVASPAAARDLAVTISRAPGLVFKGLMTYPPVGAAAAVQAFMTEAKALCEQAGLTVSVISSGGAPDMWNAHQAPIVTEYRSGTYIYNDRSLVSRGVCQWSDCALTVLATVVSVPEAGRAIIDAGTKVLTSDLLGLQGYGHVLGRPDLMIDQLSEEHGRITAKGATGLAVGQQIRIVPNHACVVSNMVDAVYALRGDKVEGAVLVAARGKVQ
ncbi:D-TA family PLP-dependent enzyme [Telmatospirillum sp.]|uniref:D-TA family PLP-dependent enzyme n=1 Tax=Telmatospirillum sp. TaxID=2079197 RepID=UPI00284872DA|nr:D-TA family PLP-dependent enzyme [Telmatospirillum sp.]MDR3439495.1 D-TA family PLP-dependent enzyme [Telmatospirillum sp.]